MVLMPPHSAAIIGAMVGRTIGKYHVVEQVGRGGMGTVYKAVDETLDRTVAIKVLNGDLLEQEAVERFRREAMTLARLNHPRIGAIHELTRDGHDLLMVMEFISGETFEKLIERAAPLPIPQAVDLCSRVLDALGYAHRAGVVHRDLKPANVIITPGGDIKVMDFGIARVQGSEHLTSHGFMVGTPAYMSPEQVRGEEVDPRMDLYAIAVVLYRLLTHHLPFQGDTAIAMIHSQLNNPPTPPRQFRADLPDWLVGALARGLAKSPADRFQTAVEFRNALQGGLSGKTPMPSPIPAELEETIGPMLTPPAMRMPAAQTPPAASHAAASSRAPSAATSTTPPAPSPAATPAPAKQTPAAPAKAEGTVTLRTPHLATAGGIVALLLVGMGVLAFIVLRQPSGTGAPAAPSQEASTAPPATTTATAPPPAATPPAEPAGPTTPPVDSTATAPAATAATPAPEVPAPASAVPSAAASAATVSAGASNTTTPPRTTPPATPARRPNRTVVPATIPATPLPAAPLVPTPPAPADAPTQNFGEVRAIAVDGNRGREIDATLFLEPGNLVIRERGNNTVLRTLPYRAIAAGTYMRGKRPRGQKNGTLPDVPDNLAGSGSLFGQARHWLTLQTSSEFLVVRLEDRNVVGVINNLETRTGLKISRLRD